MTAAAVVIFGSLFVLATRQLRLATVGVIVVFAGSNMLTVGLAPRTEITLAGCAALTAALVLYLSAGDAQFGEDPGWRMWPAIAISAIATTLAFRVFASSEADRYLQLSAFWLLAVGLGILLAAQGPVRAVLGSLLMLTGTQVVLRFEPGAHLASAIAFAWLEVSLALVGGYLIQKQRSLEAGG